AFHLFPLSADAFEVVVHPQSVVHSLVEYVDGSVLAQLGSPDMRIPIAYTLAYPERIETPCERLDLLKVGSLDFEAPDEERFPALRLAKEALRAGAAKPAILNAANEIAVASFLDSGTAFLDIAAIVRDTLDAYDPPVPRSLDEVLEVDGEARRRARDMVGKFQH
ncbi:MAG: 1-deoxy-D-xylulose-5-phosphate reductoisomerase, partial [Pseudomonadota bacterium]|nr:1-deoxy-D-xylulose-5-phosphate reductoisomerase [Pseudomonadota bacterium]